MNPRAMEDELILADLGVAERRLERLERDLNKNRSADLERERDVVTICRTALEEGRPLRSLDLKGDDLKRLRGFQFLSAKPLLIGRIPDQNPEPIAWTNTSKYRGRVFYTSLGHVDDFKQESFNKLLANALRWVTGGEAKR